jgi:hypothetical protein
VDRGCYNGRYLRNSCQHYIRIFWHRQCYKVPIAVPVTNQISNLPGLTNETFSKRSVGISEWRQLNTEGCVEGRRHSKQQNDLQGNLIGSPTARYQESGQSDLTDYFRADHHNALTPRPVRRTLGDAARWHLFESK